jgi:hypothetical protein
LIYAADPPIGQRVHLLYASCERDADKVRTIAQFCVPFALCQTQSLTASHQVFAPKTAPKTADFCQFSGWYAHTTRRLCTLDDPRCSHGATISKYGQPMAREHPLSLPAYHQCVAAKTPSKNPQNTPKKPWGADTTRRLWFPGEVWRGKLRQSRGKLRQSCASILAH